VLNKPLFTRQRRQPRPKPFPAYLGEGSAAPTTHDLFGALAGGGGALDGAMSRTRAHALSGDLAGSGGALDGALARTRLHALSGVLAGAGGLLDGEMARSDGPVTHDLSGALAGAGGALDGLLERTGAPTVHALSGALAGAGAVLDGAMRINRPHALAGVLAGAGGALVGAMARSGAFVPTLTIRVLDKAEAGSPLASSTGWDCFWYDDATTMAEAVATTPTVSLPGQSADSLGRLVLTLAGSSKGSGEYGFLMFSNGDGSTDQSPPPRSFAALVPVD
jgi:hypothetical protein